MLAEPLCKNSEIFRSRPKFPNIPVSLQGNTEIPGVSRVGTTAAGGSPPQA